MAVDTFYTCDKCGKSWNATDKSIQPIAIGLIISFGQTKIPYGTSATQQQLWCRSCVMKTGISAPYTSEDKEIAPIEETSFEDKIILLLEELGFVRGDY